MVHDTDIIELELKSKKFVLNLRKKEALQAELAAQQAAHAPQQPMVSLVHSPVPQACTNHTFPYASRKHLQFNCFCAAVHAPVHAPGRTR